MVQARDVGSNGLPREFISPGTRARAGKLYNSARDFMTQVPGDIFGAASAVRNTGMHFAETRLGKIALAGGAQSLGFTFGYLEGDPKPAFHGDPGRSFGWAGLKGYKMEYNRVLKEELSKTAQGTHVLGKMPIDGGDAFDLLNAEADDIFTHTVQPVGAKAAAEKVASKKALRFTAGKMFGSAIGMAFFAYDVHAGYKKGGLMGAAVGGAENIATFAAWEVGTAVLGGSLMWGTAGLAAAGVAGYALGETAISKEKRLRNLEFATGDSVFSAGAFTSRQRAMMALQNTHLNGRMALGNEAMLMHSSYF